MPEYLYTEPIPTNSRRQLEQRRRTQLVAEGKLDSDVPTVTQVSPDAGERLLVGQHRGVFARKLATEMEELFAASGVETVPFYDPDGGQQDGYYALSNVSLTTPNGEQAGTASEYGQTFDGVLRREGTRASHYRSVATTVQAVDNPFGSGTDATVAISARADDVQWYDSGTGATESATVQQTVTGEHGDLDVYDTTEPSFDSPTLLYDLALAQQASADMTVWDTLGRDKTVVIDEADSDTVGSATVGSATVSGETTVTPAWQRVFVTDHETDGTLVIDSERLRLHFETERNRLVAERWNDTDANWDLVQLGTSSWRLQGVDIRRVGLARVVALVTFSDGSSSHTLRLDVGRGDRSGLWTVPTNGSSPPQGLIDRLDPIAQTTDTATAEAAGIVERTEVEDA